MFTDEILFLFLLHKEFYVSEMPDWSTNGLTILVPRRRNAPKKYQLIRSYVSRWVIWAELSLFYSAVWHSQLQFSWERKSSDCAIANNKSIYREEIFSLKKESIIFIRWILYYLSTLKNPFLIKWLLQQNCIHYSP